MLVREERVKELIDGRHYNAISELLGVSYQHVSNIFRRRYNCPKSVALVLISFKERIPVDDRTMPQWLEYYFEEE